MKRRNRMFSDPSLFHILMGEPDDSCEVCRAHGITGHDLPEGAPGFRIVQMGPLDEIMRCNCPLCSQIQFEPLDEPQRGSHDDAQDDPPLDDQDPESKS